MSDVQKLLRYTWQCNNRLTLPMSGTGSAAMEASIANFIEEGEKILIAKKGYFGDRLVDMSNRYKANVSVIQKKWGQSFSLEEIKYEMKQKTVNICYRPLRHLREFYNTVELGNIRKNNCLFLVMKLHH